MAESAEKNTGIGTLLMGVGSLIPGLGSIFGGAKSTPNYQSVDVSQQVAQHQTLNIGTQSDIADQLAYLLGQAPIVEYPTSSGGMLDSINSLFNEALGISTPTAASLGDSRYSALTGGVAATKSNLNLYLIIGGVIIIAIIFIRKKLKRS